MSLNPPHDTHIHLLNESPLCRVLQGFEPVFTGGFLPISFALAQAYRVTVVETEPKQKVLAQN